MYQLFEFVVVLDMEIEEDKIVVVAEVEVDLREDFDIGMEVEAYMYLNVGNSDFGVEEAYMDFEAQIGFEDTQEVVDSYMYLNALNSVEEAFVEEDFDKGFEA